jgi:hypothetical protein
MLSHDLAKLLLARRNNDVKIEVILEEYEDDVVAEFEEDRDATGGQLVDLRDGDLEENPLKQEFLVDYNPLADCIVIKGGTISVVRA